MQSQSSVNRYLIDALMAEQNRSYDYRSALYQIRGVLSASGEMDTFALDVIDSILEEVIPRRPQATEVG